MTENNPSVVQRGKHERTHGRRARAFVPRPRFARRPLVADTSVASSALAIEEARAATRIIAREGLHRRALIAADVGAAALSLMALLWLADAGPSVAVFVLLPVLVAVNKAAGLYDRDEVVLRKTTLEEAPRAGCRSAASSRWWSWLARAADRRGARRRRRCSSCGWPLRPAASRRAAAPPRSRRYATVSAASSSATPTASRRPAKLAASGAKAEVGRDLELRHELAGVVDLQRFAQLGRRSTRSTA